MKPRSLSRFPLLDGAPLARLLHARRGEQDLTLAQRFRHVLEPFHHRHVVTSEIEGRRCLVDGQPVVHFASENFLGLEQHREVLYAARRALDELGSETGCSRYVSTHANVLDLEQSLAELLGAPATLVAQTTSQLHSTAITALFGFEGAALFLDKHAHPEMRHAALAATARGARVVGVDVSDPPALRRILGREEARGGAILVSGVYPAQGHTPDLAGLDDLCRELGLVLYVDDSGGVGILGNGGGSAAAAELSFSNLVLVASLQKALGSFGAVLAGTAPLVEALRSLSYSHGTLPPSSVEGALAAVRIARSPEGRELREKLSQISRRVRLMLGELGFLVPPGESPVIPVPVGRDIKTMMAARKLLEEGVLVGISLFPEAPRGHGSLRVCVTTLHSEDDLQALERAFRELRHFLPRYENPLRQAAHVAAITARTKWFTTA